MLQDKFPELIHSTFNFKIIVSATYKAKQTLAAKGLTPAIFLDRFYREKIKGPTEIAYSFKEKYIKQLPQFVTIDYDEYQHCRKDDKDGYLQDLEEDKISKKIISQLQQEQLKINRNITKDMINDKQGVEKFLNNQSFHWFDNSNKIFYYALSLSQNGFRVSTIDQPLGLVYVIEVQKGKLVKQIFQKIKKQSEILYRKTYELNLNQTKNLKPIVILLYNTSEGLTHQDALQYSTILKNQYNINSSNILRLPINGPQLHESAEWGHFNRPIIHFKYNLKSTDPIRLLGYEDFGKLQDFIYTHKHGIKKLLEYRIDELSKKHEQINKTSNKLMNFFKGNSAATDKKYTNDQADMRQLADKMFLLEDYKRAYEIYKSLASKLENRNQMIEINLAEMIQYCITMSKYHSLKLRSDPYGSIEKYSLTIFARYLEKSRLRHIRYLIFMTYVFHSFKTFNREYIKKGFYPEIKNGFSSNIPIVPLLVYEQYANLNLFLGRNQTQYRKYCYDLTRVASRFSEIKLHNYAIRCFLMVEEMYNQSFSNIEKYQAIQLSHLFMQTKDYKQSLKYLKKAWLIYEQRIQSQDLHKEQTQILKLIENTSRMVQEIEKHAPQDLQILVQPALRIPTVQSLTVQLVDEMLKHDEKSGAKWQDIGNIFMDNKGLMAQGFTQKIFSNIFKSFDTGIAQQKYLIHRFKGTVVNQSVLKKNSRVSFVNEPIRVSFYFRNPLRTQIQVDKVNLCLKNYNQADITLKRAEFTIKPFQSSKFTFMITPKVPGYLELNKIQWKFLKFLNQHQIKEPHQITSQYKSCYFKVNIQPAVGVLQCQAVYEDYYYQGQRGKMKIIMKNVGVEPVEKIYIAVADEHIFGFSSKDIDIKIQPSQEKMLQFDICIPLISSNIQSGEEKKLMKMLILYQTSNRFRISRTINRFNIVRVAKLSKFICEKLSTHLHLLCFSQQIEKTRKESVDLEWMIITQGYQIVKTQAAELSKQTSYFFFLKKGNYGCQSYGFKSKNQFTLQMYPQNLLQSSMTQEQSHNNIQVKFLWRKENKIGCLSPPVIPVIINPYGYLSNVFPINIKLQYQEVIEHNFQKQAYLDIPITIKLKSILKEQQYKVTVYLIESRDPAFISDAVWEGLSEKKINLFNLQLKTDINLVVIRPGIYDISHMIRYTIQNSKGKQINVSHNEYERVFITVKAIHSQEKEIHNKNDFEVFDFFTDQVVNQNKQPEDLLADNQVQEVEQIKQVEQVEQVQQVQNDSLI